MEIKRLQSGSGCTMLYTMKCIKEDTSKRILCEDRHNDTFCLKWDIKNEEKLTDDCYYDGHNKKNGFLYK